MTQSLANFSEDVIDAELLQVEISRAEAASKLNVSSKTLYNYMTWLGSFLPSIETKFLTEYGGLNKVKFNESDLSFLKKVVALRQKYSKARCEQILKHYFGDN